MNEQTNLIKDTEAKFPKIQFLGVTSLGLPIEEELIFQSTQGGKGVAFDVRLVKNNEWALTMIAGTVTAKGADGKEYTKAFGVNTGESNFIVDRATFQNYTPGQSILFKVSKNETTGRENVRVLSLDASAVATSEPVNYASMAIPALKALLTDNEIAFAPTANKNALVALAVEQIG